MSDFKKHFDIPEDIVYLNASYQTPLPHVSAQAGLKALERRSTGFWEMTATDFFEPTEKLRALVAGLWVTMPRNVAVVPSVSYGVETAIKNLRLSPGHEILVPQDDFPSNIYPWFEAAKQSGARVAMVPRPHDGSWTRAFLEAIRPGVAVVSVPLSDWSDGTRFDLRAIGRRAREVGACFVVDVSQSFGAVPFSVSEFDPDFMFSVGYKWQLGPYGLSYLYVADRWLDGQPLENNWINRRGSEDFARLIEYRDEYQDGARRFDCGQRSQFQTTPIAVESMRLLRELSVAAIHTHITGLVREMHEGLSAFGFSLAAPELLAGHMLGARHRNWPDMTSLVKRLKDRRVFLSARGSALRISPHLYNDSRDVARFLDAVGREVGVGRAPSEAAPS